VLVDVVVVSYNSSAHLRRCVEPLLPDSDLNVVISDNASSDGSLDVLAGLHVQILRLPRNGGFAYGCNSGWRSGSAPFVLFLNPDATIDPGSVRRLTRVLEEDSTAGAVGPRILEDDGTVALSQRRFPRLTSTYSQALFLHRVFPRAAWASELVSDEAAYERPGSPDWISGACLLVRRELLERLDGLDEGFFMYCEDKDLCRRVRDAGHDVRYEPEAAAHHEGGASAPRASLLTVLAESRVRYARKHRGRAGAVLERVGIALTALTHMVVASGGWTARAGHAAAFRAALRPQRPDPARPGSSRPSPAS
jgi:N-acetylglucosaminyl-diphospho-decaprenol L-rhamnosyltransferase